MSQVEQVIYDEDSNFENWGFPTYPTREEALQSAIAAHPAGKHRFVENLIEKAEVIAIRSGVEIRDRFQTLVRDERGDVPGWVLVAVMTAGLVTAIWLVADGQLTSVLDRALSSVSQP